jgi:hypothetical protein
MPQRVPGYALMMVLLAGIPAVASAQSSKGPQPPKPQPATVVRPGGTRAGIAPPPATRDHSRFRTREREGGFEGGVGVVVGSFGRPIGDEPHRRECANLSLAPVSTVPIQPHASQPVVTQPGAGGVAPSEIQQAESRGCAPRR